MSKSESSNLPDSIAKSLVASSKQLAALESLSERISKIQIDSLRSIQLSSKKIIETLNAHSTVKSMVRQAAQAAHLKSVIPRIVLPTSAIAALQDFQKTALAAIQASIPDLSQTYSAISSSVRRLQTISLFLKCCETTTWPLYLIASAEAEEDLAHYMNTSGSLDDLIEAVNEYAINYLDQDKIIGILNDWTENRFIANDKKPLLECAIKHHLNKDYFASTSILMCLVEGLIEDCDSEFNALASCDEEDLECIAKHLGLNDGVAKRRKKGYAKDQLAAIASGVESGIYFWEASAKYIATVTLANNPREELYSTNPLRNKICHGSQVDYGTAIHSLKAILVVDLLIRLSRSLKSNINDE